MHEMRTIATDDSGVCQSICLSREQVRSAPKTAERIDILFGVETPGNPGSGVAMGWARWSKSRGPRVKEPRVPVLGTKLQRGGEVRREWNGEGALGGLSLHVCPGAPEFQVTPLNPRNYIHCVPPEGWGESLRFSLTYFGNSCSVSVLDAGE